MPNAYPTTVTVNVGALSIEDVVAVARYGAQVEIAPVSYTHLTLPTTPYV